jgi:cytochrome c oxidase cbb3-type subunit 3
MSTDQKPGKQETPDDHVYDGIHELDHQLPKWWVASFYLMIAVSVVYAAYYCLLGGPSIQDEYAQAIRAEELSRLKQAGAAAAQEPSDTDLARLAGETSRQAAGHALFAARCLSCHGDRGQGGIGPNLTDDSWIHGGTLAEVARTIRQGVADKGMPPWGPVLSSDEVVSLVAFVSSIQGSKPPNPKPPQGVRAPGKN